MTWYITIRSPDHTECLETTAIGDFLQQQLGFQKRDSDFLGTDPFVPVLAVVAKGHGSGYWVGETLPETANLVDLICWDDLNREAYVGIARKIMAFTGWRAESDDDEIDLS
jgi:hypothetical protein